MQKSLNEIITTILEDRGQPLSVKEITEIIRNKKLWFRPIDNKLPGTTQISARVSNYSKFFLRKNGLVHLVKMQSSNDAKITRISWNKFGWEYPSGMDGKKLKDDFEATSGFAYEEWLFDFQN